MPYPSLQQKIDIVRKKYPFLVTDVASSIKRDKANAHRWLGRADRLNDKQQRKLVEAICEALKDTVKLSEHAFLEDDILTFCADIGVSKLEAAIFSNRQLPIPDIIVDSVFHPAPAQDRKHLVGHYLLFRHDKEYTHRQTPYLQACAEISIDRRRLLKFEDFWAGDGDHLAQTYEGFVIIAGTVTNIIGQRRQVDPQTRPEIFWQGLWRIVDRNGSVVRLYGYVSDITTEKDLLFADRMLLVRASETEVARVRNRGEYYVTRARISKVAGDELCEFLEDWKDASIQGPDLSKVGRF